MASEQGRRTYTYNFPKASNTATVAIFVRTSETVDDCEILLARRGEAADAFPGFWSLPGGFLDVGEGTMEDVAAREVLEETGIAASPGAMRLFHVSSRPETDPRDHVVNVCYWYETTPEALAAAKAGDDVAELRRVRVADLEGMAPLAFDHMDIARRAVAAWSAGVPA